MLDEDIALVRSSWAKISAAPEQTATLFYSRLFTVYPEVRPLFRGELDEQGEKLMRMMNKAVQSLDDLEPLDRVIKMMGARHWGYGVKSEDYEKMADALFWTLQERLGDDFTPETRAAWSAIYDELAELMREGANY